MDKSLGCSVVVQRQFCFGMIYSALVGRLGETSPSCREFMQVDRLLSSPRTGCLGWMNGYRWQLFLLFIFKNIAKINFIYIQGRLNGADGRLFFSIVPRYRWIGPCWPLTCQSEIYKRYPIVSTSQTAMPE